MATPTAEQIAKVVDYLPSAAADPDVWDEAKIEERWAGMAGTIRAYWYQKVSDTAGYLDIPDPGGSLPITQIHRQAKEMLVYWDEFIAKYGANADPSAGANRASIGRIKNRYPRTGSPPIDRFNARTPYTRT